MHTNRSVSQKQHTIGSVLDGSRTAHNKLAKPTHTKQSPQHRWKNTHTNNTAKTDRHPAAGDEPSRTSSGLCCNDGEANCHMNTEQNLKPKHKAKSWGAEDSVSPPTLPTHTSTPLLIVGARAHIVYEFSHKNNYKLQNSRALLTFQDAC